MINPLHSSTAAAAAAKVGAVAPTAPVKAVSKAAGADAVAVTTAAATMTAAGPPVDAEKVARIKAGIADGSYRADPQGIAQAMIAQDLKS